MIAAPHARSEPRAIVYVAVLALVTLHLAWQAWTVGAAPYPARYDYDEGVYAETAASLSHGHHLYETVFLSQPPLLIEVLSRVFDIAGRSLRSARGVVVAFSVLWLGALAVISASGTSRRAAVWAVGIALAAPAFAVASQTVQMEAPSEALAASSLAIAFVAAGRSRVVAWLWLAAGAAAGLAVMTKFTAVTCAVPLAATVFARPNTDSPNVAAAGGRVDTALRRAAALAAGAALVAIAALWWTGAPVRQIWQQTVIFHGAVARVTALDPGRTASLLLAFGLTNWLLAALGIAGLASVRLDRALTGATAVAMWLAADLAALFLWRPVWPHHLVVLVTPLAALAALAVETRLMSAGTPDTKTGSNVIPAGMLIAAWLIALAGPAAATFPQNSPVLRDGAAATSGSVRAGAWVVADDPIVPFLAGRDTPPDFCDTSEMRMRAGWLTGAGLTAAIADPRVRGVALWRGTFRTTFPEFAAQAANRFPHRWTAGDGRLILAR